MILKIRNYWGVYSFIVFKTIVEILGNVLIRVSFDKFIHMDLRLLTMELGLLEILVWDSDYMFKQRLHQCQTFPTAEARVFFDFLQ